MDHMVPRLTDLQGAWESGGPSQEGSLSRCQGIQRGELFPSGVQAARLTDPSSGRMSDGTSPCSGVIQTVRRPRPFRRSGGIRLAKVHVGARWKGESPAGFADGASFLRRLAPGARSPRRAHCGRTRQRPALLDRGEKVSLTRVDVDWRWFAEECPTSGFPGKEGMWL